jgi:CRP-like cAMP-binding protein
VDETVALCLPLLEHRQMLEATHQIEHFSYPKGSTILQQGQHVDYFFMVERGVVEVVLQGQTQKDIRIARMGPGEFFGEIELVQGGQSIASIRAASEGQVELVALHRDPFVKLLSDSPLTEEMIGRIVQARLEENRTTDRRRRNKES